MNAGVQILIGETPRFTRQAFQIAAVFPVMRHRRDGRFFDYCAQTLLLRWIAAVIQPLELERLGDGLYVVFCRQPARLIWTAHNLGHHKRGQDAENRNDNHHFDYSKSALAARRARSMLFLPDMADVMPHTFTP